MYSQTMNMIVPQTMNMLIPHVPQLCVSDLYQVLVTLTYLDLVVQNTRNRLAIMMMIKTRKSRTNQQKLLSLLVINS